MNKYLQNLLSFFVRKQELDIFDITEIANIIAENVDRPSYSIDEFMFYVEDCVRTYVKKSRKGKGMKMN